MGLAGSSAIIVATLRCLMDFYGVQIPLEVQPTLVLIGGAEELGITAGLQDRVIQVYEGLVYMDFARDGSARSTATGAVRAAGPGLLPPLYVAHHGRGRADGGVPHDIRGRFNRGDAAVVTAMGRFAALAAEAREALLARDANGSRA